MFIIFLIPVILMFVCAAKEAKVTSIYKAYGVYGRFSAYITVSLLLGGIVSILGGILGIVLGETENVGFVHIIAGIIVYGIILGLGIMMYKRIAARCPEGLRKKLLISMIITALGVGTKICVFFLGTVWTLIEPKQMTASNGEPLTVFSGEVYDQHGNHVGSVSGHNTFRPNRNYKNR